MTTREINKLRLLSKIYPNIGQEKIQKYFCMNCVQWEKCSALAYDYFNNIIYKNKITFDYCRIFTCFEKK